MTVNLPLFFLLGKHEISWYCHARMKALLKKKIVAAVAGGLLSLGFVSCQTATPSSRIAENPAMFKALPPQQQSLVQQGQISQGMKADAVFLAWGRPDAQSEEGQKNGNHVIRWIYKGYDPVTVINDNPYPYWGPYGWYAGPDTSTVFIPKKVAYVEFVNGKVTSWMKQKDSDN